MKDLQQLINNPRLYYVLIPVIVAIWPLWAGLVGTSKAKADWDKQLKINTNGSLLIASILELDGERILNKKPNTDFSYPATVHRVATSVGIPASNCNLKAKAVIKLKSGQESQDADVTVNQVDMATFARFLSTMQLEGANIQCTSISLTNQKGSSDLWSAQMSFKYFKG